MKRYSSLPAVGFSLFGMESQWNEKQSLFVCPSKIRFYGKKVKPRNCKSSESSKASKFTCKNAKPPPCNFTRSFSKTSKSDKASSKCETRRPESQICDRAEEEKSKEQVCSGKIEINSVTEYKFFWGTDLMYQPRPFVFYFQTRTRTKKSL